MTTGASPMHPTWARLAGWAAVLLAVFLGPLLMFAQLWYMAALALMVIVITSLLGRVLGMPHRSG